MILPADKLRTLLRLYEESRYSGRAKARLAGVSHPTVAKTEQMFVAEGLTCAQANKLNDDQLISKIYPNFPFRKSSKQHTDFLEIKKQREALRTSKGLPPLEHFWLKDVEKYGENALCRASFYVGYHLATTSNINRPRMKQFPVDGDIFFVDYAGNTLPYGALDEHTAFFFVGVFGGSTKVYIKPTDFKTTECWLASIEDAFYKNGGRTTLLVHDNDVALVHHKSPKDKSEPNFTKVYKMFMRHHNITAAPIKIGTPEHNYLAENLAGIFNKVFYPYLCEHKFLTLEELNERVQELVRLFNAGQLRSSDGKSRDERFDAKERQELKPMAEKPFEFPEKIRTCTVNNRYGFKHKGTWYSIPHDLIGKKIDMKIGRYEIEVLHQGVTQRVYQLIDNEKVLNVDDMPANHAVLYEQDEEYFVNWAQQFGQSAVTLIKAQFRGVPTPDIEGWKACTKIRKLFDDNDDIDTEMFSRNCEFVVSRGKLKFYTLESALKYDIAGSDSLHEIHQTYLATQAKNTNKGDNHVH